MDLPKIDLPIYDFTIPSSGKVIRVRPFTVKEEKLLLMALEGKNPVELVATVKQVINNCIQVFVNEWNMKAFKIVFAVECPVRV